MFKFPKKPPAEASNQADERGAVLNFKPCESVERIDSLEKRLEAMRQYGEARLGFMGKGWYACIDMHVASAGAQFKISTEFGMATPSAAMEQLEQRIAETLRGIAK